MSPVPPDLISTAVAAKILNLTPRRVRQLRADLGGVNVGGSLAFSRADVEAFKDKPRAKAGYPKGRPRTPPPAPKPRKGK
jgi:hypothetical protein